MANSEGPENPKIPLILGFLGCLLFAISIIIAGYFHYDMHLLTTLKNAREFYS